LNKEKERKTKVVPVVIFCCLYGPHPSAAMEIDSMVANSALIRARGGKKDTYMGAVKINAAVANTSLLLHISPYNTFFLASTHIFCLSLVIMSVFIY
jgi:hypothetical protein